MPTGTPEERIALLESIVLSGLSGNQLAPLNTILSNDFITFYSSTEGKMARISGIDFINQLGSGNITFVENGDITEIRQDNIIELLISKVGKTGQYSDLLGKPNILTNDDLSNYTLRGGYTGTSQDLKNEIDGLDQAVVLQNTPFDASSGSFPGSNTAQAGFKYIVNVSGTVDGVNFEIGDSIIATVDNADSSTYSGNWIKINNSESVQNLQQVTNQGATTTSNIQTQGYSSTGTRSNSDLIVLIGDYDITDVGVRLEINTSTEEIIAHNSSFITAALVLKSSFSGSISAGTLTQDRSFNLPNNSGFLKTERTIDTVSSTSYTVQISDYSKVKVFTSSSNITVTVNSDSLNTIGHTCEIDVYGTGVLSIVAGTATLRVNSNRLLESDGQYSRIAIQKITSNEYRVFGELAIA